MDRRGFFSRLLGGAVAAVGAWRGRAVKIENVGGAPVDLVSDGNVYRYKVLFVDARTGRTSEPTPYV